jgi:hypothetical protein
MLFGLICANCCVPKLVDGGDNEFSSATSSPLLSSTRSTVYVTEEERMRAESVLKRDSTRTSTLFFRFKENPEPEPEWAGMRETDEHHNSVFLFKSHF